MAIARVLVVLLAPLAVLSSPAGQTPVGSGPIALALLFDVSASVDFRLLEWPKDFSKDVDEAVLGRLEPEDRIAIGAFGADVSLTGFLADDRQARRAAVRALFKDRSIGLNGPSRIWDALDEAIAALAAVPGRRAIILLTDGKASGNRTGSSAVIRRARTAGVRVFVIASGGWGTRARRASLDPHAALEQLATETDGLFLLDDVGDAFRPRRPRSLLQRIMDTLGRP